MAFINTLVKTAVVSWAAAPIAAASPLARHATLASRDTAAQTDYDFIVVGGGVSGLTVANRLTEDPNVNVLVIEAGPFDRGEDSVLVPGDHNPFGPYLASLESVPQTALNNKSYIVPLGKAVGGGSVINSMVWLRGAKDEYDSWETLGASGWKWDSLLPYFKKSENFTPPDATFAHEANISWVDNVHGNSGLLQVSYPNFFYKGSANWWTAALGTGISPAKDSNSGDNVGLTYYTTSVDFTNRTRSDARTAYYDKVATRSNYHILTGHTVSKILFNGTKTVGVEYIPSAGGQASTMSPSKEVLVAGGGVYTPQLLQLSGIGPKSLLEGLGIHVVADLPGVGANFQDTANVGISYNFSGSIQPNSSTLSTNATYNAEQLALYESSRQGALVVGEGQSTNLALITLCMATSSCHDIIKEARAANPTEHLPPGTDAAVAAGYKAQRQIILSQLDGQDTPAAYITWTTSTAASVFLSKPLSRGSVAINSTDPLASPVIDYGSMTDPTDFDVLIAAFLKNRAIMQSPAMKVLNPREVAPFGDDIRDEAALKDAIKLAILPTLGHECCTAAMLPQKIGGVVNSDGEVYAIQGLRIIDSSTMPMIMSTPLMPTVYGGGEKIADVIRQKYM